MDSRAILRVDIGYTDIFWALLKSFFRIHVPCRNKDSSSYSSPCLKSYKPSEPRQEKLIGCLGSPFQGSNGLYDQDIPYTRRSIVNYHIQAIFGPCFPCLKDASSDAAFVIAFSGPTAPATPAPVAKELRRPRRQEVASCLQPF